MTSSRHIDIYVYTMYASESLIKGTGHICEKVNMEPDNVFPRWCIKNLYQVKYMYMYNIEKPVFFFTTLLHGCWSLHVKVLWFPSEQTCRSFRSYSIYSVATMSQKPLESIMIINCHCTISISYSDPKRQDPMCVEMLSDHHEPAVYGQWEVCPCCWWLHACAHFCAHQGQPLWFIVYHTVGAFITFVGLLLES